MTVEELRGWLRTWVAQTTGLSAEEITDTKPLENFGLSSRDAVVLSGELENSPAELGNCSVFSV